ncbi:MAG: hypothetical protein IKK24_01175 [Clostridia bacterium]|nr:hypothetical protein [Clostridia bacterium]
MKRKTKFLFGGISAVLVLAIIVSAIFIFKNDIARFGNSLTATFGRNAVLSEDESDNIADDSFSTGEDNDLSYDDETFDEDLFDIIYGDSEDDEEYIPVYGIATYSPKSSQKYASSFPIETQTFSLSMDASGVIDSFYIKGLYEETFDAENKGKGFMLHQCRNDGSGTIEKTYNLDKVYFDTTNKIPLLVATCNKVPAGLKEKPVVKLAVQYTDKYITFTVMSVTNYPINDFIKLEIDQKVSNNMAKGMALDFMTKSVSLLGVMFDNLAESIKSPLTPTNPTGNPLGKFAYYVAADEEDEDDTIMRLWVNENMPRPYVENLEKKWTLSFAREWLDGWVEELGAQGRTIAYPGNAVTWEGDTPTVSEDTVKLMKAAKKAGTKIFYLYSTAWHAGAEFEYRDTKAGEIRTDYFVPRGADDDIYMKVLEADGTYSTVKVDSIEGSESMRVLGDYCIQNDVYLALHTTAGGLGQNSRWFGEDRRSEIPGKLESSIDLELVEDISDTATVITVRPRVYTNVDGTKFSTPYQIERGDGMGTSGRTSSKYPNYPNSFAEFTNQLQFIDDDGNSEICLFDKSSRHDNGDGTWTFTLTSRASKGTARNWSKGTVVGHIATAYHVYVPDNESYLLYKSALNMASLANKAKIYHMEFDSAENHCINGNFGYEKFAAYVYSLTDHYLTSHDSGNTNPAWFMEFKFNRVRNIVNVGNEGFGELYNEMETREGTRPYQANFMLGSKVGSSSANKLGLQGERNNTMFAVDSSYLKHGLADDVIDTVRNFVEVNRLLSDDQRAKIGKVYDAQKTPFSGGVYPSSYTIFDIRKDLDIFGKIKGYNVVPVTIMTRANNVDAPFYSGSEYGANCPQQFIKIGSTLRLSNVYEKQEPKFILRNWHATNYSSKSSTPIHSGSIVLNAKNDEEVVAMSSRYLVSSWGYTNIPTNVDLAKQSAIGMWITGDGSGSTVVIQSGNGNTNYVVDVDFVGKRYVEVPNHIASYATAHWGMNDERRENSNAPGMSGGFKVGIGRVPANTSANIVVEDIRAITNINQALVNPTIKLENGAEMRIDTSSVTINAKDYIRYTGEKNLDGTAKIFIYDGNWLNKRETKGYITGDFVVDNGYSDITITSDIIGTNAVNWISTQFTTEATGNDIIYVENK